MLVNTDLSVICAGGFIVALLPGAPEKLIGTIERNIAEMGQVTNILQKGTVDDLVGRVLFGLEPEILSRRTVEYRCYCSRDRVQRALESIGREALEELSESGENAEINCQFCNEVYTFTPEEIRLFLAQDAK